MAIGKDKKRVQITFDIDNLEVIKTISDKNRNTVSDTINLLIEKHLKDEYLKIKEDTSK